MAPYVTVGVNDTTIRQILPDKLSRRNFNNLTSSTVLQHQYQRPKMDRIFLTFR